MAYAINSWGGQLVGYEVERMPYQISKERTMYLAKKPYENLMKDKKINIISIELFDAYIPYLQIKYETLKGCTGQICFCDIGPRPSKPKKEPKPKPEKKPKIEKPKNVKQNKK